jgi:hypothetical protein
MMLKGASAERERTKESATCAGSRSARTTVAGAREGSTELMFWPMKTR